MTLKRVSTEMTRAQEGFAVAVTPAAQAPVSPSDRTPVLVWVIAAVFVAVEVAVSGRYGFHPDEMYFIVAGHHLAFGYVDQPPLAPLLTRITGVFGVSPTAIRIIPALAGGAIAVMAARFAALFGAGRRGQVLAALTLPLLLPVLPIGDVRDLPASAQQSSLADTIGWPQLTRAVAAQDTALAQAGHPPTSIFTGYYAEASALDVLGSGYHLPPVLSGHNAYWMWGPGRASDRTVLVIDALGSLRPYFASCRLLTTYYVPDHVQNDWTGLQIGVCTGPVAGWPALWPHLRHYD
jgi:hypothetical protein